MTWSQHWLDCLFLHFPVPASEVKRLVPPRLEVETFGGSAWISYVLFRLKLRPAWLPFIPGFSSLVELNIRTYVRHRGQSGIYFLRILADNRLAITAAKWLTPLPYEYARFAADLRHIHCQSTSDPNRRLCLQLARPTSFAELRPGTLDAWLLERYRLFLGGPSSSVVAADVEHPPWQAASIAPQIHENTLAKDVGLDLTAAAAAHYSPGVAARFSAFRVVGGRGSPAEPWRRQTRMSAPISPARAGGRCGGR